MACIQSVATIQGHTERCWAIDWHPTQPILASCSSDKSVRLSLFSLPLASADDLIEDNASAQHMQNGNERKGKARECIRFKQSSSSALPLAHTRTVRSLAWHPHGNMLATASFDSTVGIWQRAEDEGDQDEESDATREIDWLNWESTSSLEGHENEVKAVAWSNDGTLLATCGRDKSVWVWEASEVDSDAPDFECVAVTMDHTQDVKHVAWHSSQHVLASASYDDTARIYQPDIATDDWESTHVLPPASSHTYQLAHPNEPLPFPRSGHSSTIWAVCFSPESVAGGNLLATCSEDTSIRIWQRHFVPPEQLPDRKTVYRIGVAEKERWTCVGEYRDPSVFERAIYSLDWSSCTLSDSETTAPFGYIAAGGSDGTLAVLQVSANAESNSDHKFTLSLSCKVEFAHGVSEINCVRWCSSKPARRSARLHLSSDREEEDGDMDDILTEQRAASEATADRLWRERWENATSGVLATAGDDGTVKIWQFHKTE